MGDAVILTDDFPEAKSYIVIRTDKYGRSKCEEVTMLRPSSFVKYNTMEEFTVLPVIKPIKWIKINKRSY